MSAGKDILSDIESDLGHLYHLLDIAVETLIEVDHGESPSNRPYLERLGAILWIARDRAQGVVGDLAWVPPCRAGQNGSSEGKPKPGKTLHLHR